MKNNPDIDLWLAAWRRLEALSQAKGKMPNFHETSIGQSAYHVWERHLGWAGPDGKPLPSWSELTPRERDAWEVAARAGRPASAPAAAPAEFPNIGRHAYDVYCNERGWKSFNGDLLPGWDRVQPDIQHAWIAAARGVLEAAGLCMESPAENHQSGKKP